MYLCIKILFNIYMRYKLFSLLMFLTSLNISAQMFDDYFENKTLRLDYIFAGDSKQQDIYLDELVQLPNWYGRKNHLSELPLQGNGQITVRNQKDRKVIYRHSFSSLFQEWLATPEAKQTRKSFENVFLVPFPKDTIEITVELFDYHARIVSTMTHIVSPTDILIRKPAGPSTPYYIIKEPEDYDKCIHVAFVAEGYTETQMTHFLEDCKTAMSAIFRHEPFKTLQNRFMITAVCSVSDDSGVSEPGNNIWKSTALKTCFDTFYMTRYLTTLQIKNLHNVLAGTPYEHIIILANTEHYGGGGIYNSYNLSYTRGNKFEPVVVHEFGHSFGGLGDEYAYGDSDPYYFADTEPWEPNLTTLSDFASKWQDMMGKDPRVGLFEGAGYLPKGVYRPSNDCRMKTNEEPDFCPVCQRALTRLIYFYTE